MTDLPKGLSDPMVLHGNQPQLLEPYGAWWFVEAGEVALFSVVLRDGEPWGARDPLFNVEAGDALFGMDARLSQPPRGVLAVALGEATLRQGDERALLDWRDESPDALAATLERWSQRWGEAFEDEPRGDEGDWLEHRLPRLQRWVLRSLGRRADAARVAERERASESDRHSRESGRLALQRLTDVLGPGESPAPPTGDDVFRAAHVVGRAQGIEILPAPGFEQDDPHCDPIRAIARASRVALRTVTLTPGWQREDCGPLLGTTRDGGRPVALLPRADGTYQRVDPARGERVTVSEAVAADLEPQATSFYRPFPDRVIGPWDLIAFALAGRRRELTGILALAALVALLSMAAPIATGWIVDYAIPDADRPLIWHLFLALLAAAFGMTFSSLASGLLFLRVEVHADSATQAAVWARLLELEAGFFRRFTAGDLESRVSTVAAIRSLLSATTVQAFFPSVIALLNLILMLYYSVDMALVACAAGLITALLATVSAAVVLRYERTIQALGGELFGGVVGLVQGIGKLRVAAAEERAFLSWARRYGEQQETVLRSERLKDGLQVANLWIGTAATVALFWIASALVSGPAPSLTAGAFLAFTVAYGAFLGGVNGLSQKALELVRVKALAERARPILEAKPERRGVKSDPGRLQGHLALDRVTFRYRDSGPPTLDDVSVHAAPGERIALVGPSGAGKSTILRLLLGFESPQSGRVLVDGQDLAGLDLTAVRRQFGVAFEGGRLNAGSIFENVAGSQPMSPGDVQRALTLAGLGEEVGRMPMGLHTVISEGGRNLSGGQRQRLLIARALAQRPRVLLFDEATSALDNRTQAVVTESLRGVDATLVVAAHRLSTVRDADRIYVIDGGKVVQTGTFEELRSEGLFARLMARQQT